MLKASPRVIPLRLYRRAPNGKWRKDQNDNRVFHSYNYVELDGSPLWLTDNSAPGLEHYTNGFPMSVREDSKDYTTRITNQGCVLLMEYLLQNPPLTQAVDVAVQGKKEEVRYLAKAASNSCIYFQQEGAKHSFTYEMKTGHVTVNLQQ